MRWLLAHWRTPCCGSRARSVLARLLRRVDHLTSEETTGERRCGSVALSLVDRLRRLRGQASRNRLTPPLCNPRARILKKLASRCFRGYEENGGASYRFAALKRYIGEICIIRGWVH